MIWLIIILCFSSFVWTFLKLSPQLGGKPSIEQLEKYGLSPHRLNSFFQNQIETPMNNPDVSFSKTMRDFIFSDDCRVPKVALPIHFVDKLSSVLNNEKVTVTWLGHSSVCIQFEGSTLFFDPMFGHRASPFRFLGPKRFNTNPAFDIKSVPPLDAIIISHDHYDHLDYWTIKVLKERTKKYLVPLGVAPHLLRWGVKTDMIEELDWGESFKINSQVEVIATPARHFSGRRLRDRNKTLWTSWVVRSERHRLYFSGDSGYGNHFFQIGSKYGPFDLTLLENGAYNNAWPNIHMMPEQTVQAHIDLKGQVLLPIHWAQFNLSLHPWTEPIERLLKESQNKNIHVATPLIGESFIVNEKIPSTTWWKI